MRIRVNIIRILDPEILHTNPDPEYLITDPRKVVFLIFSVKFKFYY